MSKSTNKRRKGLVLGYGINDADYRVTKYEDVLDKYGNKVYYPCGKVTKKRLIWQCPFYRKWKGVIERCYCLKFKTKHPTYTGCYIQKEWLYFSNFKKWMEQQDWEGKVLDKDILQQGNKLYSEDTCIFVDEKVNLFVTEGDARRGVYPIGVVYNEKNGQNPYRSVCSNPFTGKKEYLGFYNTPLRAHEEWRKFKIKCLHKMFEKEWINLKVYEALLSRYNNYKHK